jgi:hypothetical protein
METQWSMFYVVYPDCHSFFLTLLLHGRADCDETSDNCQFANRK